jgi:hypothetical protein
MEREIEVAIFDGEVLIQRSACTLKDLPGGRPGVVWRGVVYPLLPGDQIDVGAMEPEASPEQPFALIAGEDSTWVLVRGLASALGEASGSARRRGHPGLPLRAVAR